MAGLPHRTTVYIDGFDFYYGALRGKPWKWLDLGALFTKVLRPQNNVTSVEYFTARVQPSDIDPDVSVRQDAYLRALSAHCPRVELHYGHFLRHTSSKGPRHRDAGRPKRKTSRQLLQHADFVKPIREWMLPASQLPDPIPGTSIRKPSGW